MLIFARSTFNFYLCREMNTEFYIAQRLSSRKHSERAGIMERVATVATAISLTVIMVTLSVVVGFKQSIDTLLSAASADIVVTAPQSMGIVSPVLLEHGDMIDAIIQRQGVERYSTYIAKEGIVKSDDNIVGVMLKGVDSLYNFSFFEQSLVRGSLPRIGCEPRTRDVILSSDVAQKMEVDVGDRIEMVFVDEKDGLLRDRFQISGIFKTGLDVVDNMLIITDMRNVERFYRDEGVTGYELWLDNDVEVETMANELNDEFVDLYLTHKINAEAFTMQAIHPNLFGWLATHDVNALFITIIMIVVALLNMITALLIIVLERQRMIGELRAMGMSRRSVVKIFIYRALFIVVRGVVWGSVIGILLALIQHLFGVVPLPAEGYILSSVPAALCWGLWLLAIVVAVGVTMIMMILPSLFAAQVSPAKAIRYE